MGHFWVQLTYNIIGVLAQILNDNTCGCPRALQNLYIDEYFLNEISNLS